MAQEVVPKTAVHVRAVDESRDISDRQFEVIRELHDTDAGVQGSEGVGCDLGHGIGESAEER